MRPEGLPRNAWALSPMLTAVFSLCYNRLNKGDGNAIHDGSGRLRVQMRSMRPHHAAQERPVVAALPALRRRNGKIRRTRPHEKRFRLRLDRGAALLVSVVRNGHQFPRGDRGLRLDKHLRRSRFLATPRNGEDDSEQGQFRDFHTLDCRPDPTS